MKWKYYIPAVWNRDERHTWEDIWLLPDDEDYHGGSVWLTVDSLTSAAEYLAEEDSPPQQIPPGAFSIEGTDMVVGVEDFSKDDLLHWVAVWLKESGLLVSELVEGTFEQFKNSNEEARALTQALEKIREEDN